ETDEDTRRKMGAALGAGLGPVLCVGETLAERDAGHTLAVVVRQLAAALSGLDSGALSRVVIAYEPVWAIGTGRNATPQDAAAALLAERELDGVLVGGASLDPEGWAQLVQTGAA